MKKFLFISLCVILYTSCASSQNAAIRREAQQKVDKVKTLISLNGEQEKKMVDIEKDFISNSKKLTYSSNYNAKLTALKDKRVSKIKEILSREQFITFGIIENDNIKKVPVRFQ